MVALSAIGIQTRKTSMPKGHKYPKGINKKNPGEPGFFTSGRKDYDTTWMFEACLPLGPVVTSKLTRWFSCRDLKPLELIAEKCAKRSSPPLSGVMKPKPFASLNHLTVPVSILFPIYQKNWATCPISIEFQGKRLTRGTAI